METSVSLNQDEAAKKFEQDRKVQDEKIREILLVLSGLSHRKARNILEKVKSYLSDVAILNTEPLSDKNYEK